MLKLKGNKVIYNNCENLCSIQNMNFMGSGFSITLSNGSIVFIPEQCCTLSEREVFNAYHKFYKDTDGVKPKDGPTLEQLKANKITELDIAYNAEINSGFMWKGRLFGLDQKDDQLNLEELKNNVALGLITEGTLEYYAKGQPYEPFSNSDFMDLYKTAMKFKNNRIKACKTKKVQVNKATTVNEVQSIVWEPIAK
jgi:hypothetical protein